MSFSHRPTLQQKNKPFKSGHATKGARKRAAKGNVAPDPTASRGPKTPVLRTSGSAEGSRKNRRNEARQVSQQKRAALVESTRIFGTGLRGENRGGTGRHSKAGAPRICAILSLTPDVNEWDVVRALERDGEALGVRPMAGKSADEAMAQRVPICELDATRFRQAVQFLPMPYGALLPAMDACRCADFVILLLSAETSIEPGSWGELCLRSLQAHGMPQILAVVPSLGIRSDSKKKKNEEQSVRKSLLSFVQYFCPDTNKVHVLDEAASRSVLVRTLVTTAPKRVAWRDFRAWCVSEQASYVPEDDGYGTLKVQGWIRGAPLSANRLVHIPDYGDFMVDQITYAPPGVDMDTVPEETMQAQSDDVLVPGAVLQRRQDDEADDLVSENEPDALANEQTWPTEEEMAEGEARMAEDDLPPALPGTTPREIQKHSAGKKYQAAWIIESDDDDDEALWSHVHGEWVVCENVERAARLATARDWSALERIMSRADAKAYLASLHDGSRPLALSDKDTDILLTHLVHDARAIQHDGDVYKWGTARVTEQDRGILAVKGLHAQLERQVDAWQARMERAQATVRRALQAKEREAVTLSYLRTQKQLESMVDKRVLALEKVHTLLLSMDQAVGDAQLMQAYTASEKTLRSLLADPSLQPDHIDRTMDALAEAVHDQNAVTDALSSAPDDELADELAQLELDTLPSPPATQPEATSPETTSLSMKTTHDTQKQAVPA